MKNINTSKNPMEKTWSAEKNRTTVGRKKEEKKRGGGGGEQKKGEVLRTERSPMMMKRWVDRSRDSS